jgi:hypothetical protein
MLLGEGIVLGENHETVRNTKVVSPPTPTATCKRTAASASLSLDLVWSFEEMFLPRVDALAAKDHLSVDENETPCGKMCLLEPTS